jgi:hypothetical protein
MFLLEDSCPDLDRDRNELAEPNALHDVVCVRDSDEKYV